VLTGAIVIIIGSVPDSSGFSANAHGGSAMRKKRRMGLNNSMIEEYRGCLAATLILSLVLIGSSL
jgi:hypothetical protein